MNYHASKLGICDIRSEGCFYITFKAPNKNADELLYFIRTLITDEGINAEALVGQAEYPVFDKYDEHIPPELLRRAYACDRLCPEEVIYRFE